jgi:hypothetical protein
MEQAHADGDSCATEVVARLGEMAEVDVGVWAGAGTR